MVLDTRESSVAKVIEGCCTCPLEGIESSMIKFLGKTWIQHSIDSGMIYVYSCRKG